MEERITREELLEKLFNDDYEHLKGKKLRMTRVRVPGKSIDFAHVFTPSDPSVYQNLALHIGVHEGEDHTGESIGIIRITPWEAIVVATDVAVKAADVEVGFMDRFSWREEQQPTQFLQVVWISVIRREIKPCMNVS